MTLQDEHEDVPDYVLDIIPAYTLTWIIRRRVRQHQEFAEESEYAYPHVLFVAGNDSTERRIVKLTEEMYDDFKVFTTTLERLLSDTMPKIWQDSEEYDEDETQSRIALPSQYEG